MASKRPTTIAEYIRAAPREGQPHLRRLYDRVEPSAIQAPDDPEHYREARIRRDGGGAARPGAHLSGGRDGWPDLLLGVLFIAAFAKTRASDQRVG